MVSPITTIITAWYRTKNKYGSGVYQKWMSFFFKIHKCTIVVFTDETSLQDILPYQDMPNVHIVVKEIPMFLTHQYLSLWRKNALVSARNHPVTLNMNMIYNEKINFLLSAVELQYVTTPWIMWLDIGYFRCNQMYHISPRQVAVFPDEKMFEFMNPNQIYIGCVADKKERSRVKNVVTTCTEANVPTEPTQIIDSDVVATGCFQLSVTLLPMLHTLYYAKLESYLISGTYVKDDQTIFTNLVFSSPEWFVLVFKDVGLLRHNLARWMVFQLFF
jgi:hypothetical protein